MNKYSMPVRSGNDAGRDSLNSGRGGQYPCAGAQDGQRDQGGGAEAKPPSPWPAPPISKGDSK